MLRVRNVLIRFAALWFVEGISLLLVDALTPGITIADTPGYSRLAAAMSIALVLAVMNAVARPVLLLLTLPLNMLTYGFTTLLVNAVTLGLTAWLLPEFQVAGIGPALAGGLVLAAANALITSVISVDDDNSFYDGVVEWLGRRQKFKGAAEPGRGLVMLEIDGLSYARMKRAAERGWMPECRAMLRGGSHSLSRIDCGLPSQTSSCQAGILFGDNDDIPAFRWYEKSSGRLWVSNHFADAANLNARLSHGRGLLRGGSSINNLMAGDAEKDLLTMGTLQNAPPEVQRLRQEDLYLFWLNPYIFARTTVLTAWDVVVELFEAVRQRIRDEQPRMNRLHKAYPLLRALTNVFLRELSLYMVTLDILRGAPAIYTTFVGYDEVAHHAGPDTSDALNTLRAFDRGIRRIRQVIQHKAPRPYDLFILSDHGQSAGATFLQRYGMTLAGAIESLTHARTSAAGGSDTGQNFVAVLAQELKNALPRRPGRRADRLRQRALARAGWAIERRVERSPDALAPAAMDAPVVVCAGGNMAHAYFNLHPGKVTLGELNAAYPGLVDALASHDGIGFVVAFDPQPIAVGRRGARNLVNGAVTGEDPLAAYGDAGLRAAQLLYLAGFTHAGDLIVNSAVFPGGQVAAFEELIGSHGGLGGEQTDAFLLHPSDMRVAPTANSAEVFAQLDARRGAAVPAPAVGEGHEDAEARAWAPRVVWAGLRDWRVWTRRAIRALAFDARVYAEAARDAKATGPALLMALLGFSLAAAGAARNSLLPGTPPDRALAVFAALAIGWVALVSLAGAARGGGRRRRQRESSAVCARVLGLSLAPMLLLGFAFLPRIGGVVVAVVVLLEALAYGAAMRNGLRIRWRATLGIPAASLALTALALVAGWFMLGGLSLTLQSLAGILGVR